MTPRVVYSPNYDLYLPLPMFDRLHPFDGRKFSRAYQLLQDGLGSSLQELTHTPGHPATLTDLLLVHTPDYIQSLDSAQVVARALEIPALALVPAGVRERHILTPMRLAVQGTIDAMELALRHGFVFHLGAGFHHAFADHGEGFCLYADAAVGIRSLRSRGLLSAGDTILIIDLDAHRGNGCEDIFSADPSVRFLDIYNFQIYPGPLDADETQAPFIIPIKSRTSDAEYQATLTANLPKFLEANSPAKLAIYNAGTDIVAGDPLGQLNLSEEAVLHRDRFVIESLASKQIPTVVLTSGGYTSRSHVLIAESAAQSLERFGIAA